MEKWFLVGVVILLTGTLSGCQKKTVQDEASIPVEEAVDAALTENQEIAQSDEMAAVTDEMTQTFQGSVGETVDAATMVASGIAETVSNAIPSPQEIQTALKSAGFYQGSIDGNIGPKTKQAIKDFQFKNNLIVDGKVGSKTWSKLSSYAAQANTSAPTTMGEWTKGITEFPAAE